MAQTDFTLPICKKLRDRDYPLHVFGGPCIPGELVNPDGPEAADTIDELYEALIGMLRVCPSEKGGMRLAEYDAARAALARARGEVTP